jgi:hypothetical protein
MKTTYLKQELKDRHVNLKPLRSIKLPLVVRSKATYNRRSWLAWRLLVEVPITRCLGRRLGWSSKFQQPRSLHKTHAQILHCEPTCLFVALGGHGKKRCNFSRGKWCVIMLYMNTILEQLFSSHLHQKK